MPNPVLIGRVILNSGGAEILVSDTFSRADDATTMGNAETGQAWTVNSGTWGITSNTAQLVTGAAGRHDFAYINSGQSDFVAEVTLATVQDEGGICIAYVDDTHVMWTAFSGASLWLARKNGGGALGVASTVVANANGDVLRVVKQGTVIDIYVNGVRKITYTLTAAEYSGFGTATKQGLYSLNATTARFDNFKLQRSLS